MAFFTGTMEDFEKYIGPRMRNIVQTSIGKKFKLKIGKCEECGSLENLELAHIKGKDRKTLIQLAYKEFVNDNKINNLNLNNFETNFRDLHFPLNETFKILCKTHHNEYDNVKSLIEIPEEFVDHKIESSNVLEQNESNSMNNNGILPIYFYPEDTIEFKELLLSNRSAYITIYFNDGNTDKKEWTANRFNENSDLIRNLRSRPEFRQGNWQDANIQKIEVEINYKY